MSQDSPSIRPQLTRFPTGIVGLDTILRGGLFVGGVYMIQGVPGAGKTILANQICFGNLAAGGSVVYLTLLAESHARLIQQMQTLEFFDRTAIPDRIYYVSAFRQLQTDGLSGVLATAQSEVVSRNATVLVIDGVSVASEAAESSQEMKRLVHDLQALASMQNCTIFLLASGDNAITRAEDTMVDGRILLEADLLGSQPERRISIMKSRGDGALAGSHAFVIDRSGLRIYPRMEAVYKDPPAISEPDSVTSSGLAALDSMFDVRGLPVGSVTVLAGPSGSGKTSFALNFLSASNDEEPALAIGFYESPDMLLRKARALGVGLQEAVQLGFVEFNWRAPGDYLLDELGYLMLAEIDRRRVRRLVIDGLAGIVGAIGYKSREHRFVACLFNEIRRRGVTTLIALETGIGGWGAVHPSSGVGLSTWADNVIELDSAQGAKGVQRSLAIAKARDSGYDNTVRSFTISGEGILLGAPLAVAQGGVGHGSSPTEAGHAG